MRARSEGGQLLILYRMAHRPFVHVWSHDTKWEGEVVRRGINTITCLESGTKRRPGPESHVRWTGTLKVREKRTEKEKDGSHRDRAKYIHGC